MLETHNKDTSRETERELPPQTEGFLNMVKFKWMKELLRRVKVPKGLFYSNSKTFFNF